MPVHFPFYFLVISKKNLSKLNLIFLWRKPITKKGRYTGKTCLINCHLWCLRKFQVSRFCEIKYAEFAFGTSLFVLWLLLYRYMSGRCSDWEQSLKTKYSQAGSALRLLLGLLTDQVQVTVLHTNRLTLCTSVNLPGEWGHVSSPVEQHR